MPRGAPFKRTRKRRRKAFRSTATGQLALMKRNQTMAIRAIANARTSGFIGLESKFRDSEIDTVTVGLAWAMHDPTTIDCLSAVPQNDSANGRDGRVYHIDKIFIRGFLRENNLESQTGPITEPQVKLMLILDTMTNKAQMTAAQVMDEALTNDILAFRNLEFTTRFKVLKSQSWVPEVHQMNEGAANLFARPQTFTPIFDWAVIFKEPLRVTCFSNGGTVANILDNSLHIIGIATNAITRLSYHCRIRYRG